MESKRLFYVVEFPEEEDNGSCPMAIVSSGWIFTENGKQYCWWPNYKNDRTRDNAIKSHTEIGPENASMCFINIKYKTESFEKAKKKLKMLETESDVDTDSSANIKRKSIPSGRLQDYVLSDSDDSNGIPSIPHPPVVQKNIRRLSQVSEAAENSFTQLNNNNEVCTNCNSSYELLMELYKKQEKYMLELNEKLDYLTGLMQNNVFSEDRTVGQDVILPVETLQDLQNLDNEFLDNPDKYNQYLDVLKLVGGKDCSDTTRRVMAKLLGHELALTINWSGRNEKPAFHSLKEVVKLICDAVKLNPICKTYTTSLVEMAIKAWLRGACDRNGGRSNRKK